jgi:nicotinamidase-related amidase
MKGVLVVDMINEFVTGKFGSRRAQSIVPNVRKLCERAVQAHAPIFFVCDAHHPDDPELRVWGAHAMVGTSASQIVPELREFGDGNVFRKRQYSGFFNTGLDDSLRQAGVDELIFAGISADICVQHNVADAFYRGYRCTVVRDCVESIRAEDRESALKYMRKIYGASVVSLSRVKF